MNTLMAMDISKQLNLYDKFSYLVNNSSWCDVYQFINNPYAEDSNKTIQYVLFPVFYQMDLSQSYNDKTYKNAKIHTDLVLNNLSKILKKIPNSTFMSEYTALFVGALLHDIGKPRSKSFDLKLNKWTFHNHEEIGYNLAKDILKYFHIRKELENIILDVIRFHGFPPHLEDVSERGIQRLIQRVGPNLKYVLLLCEADFSTKNKKKIQAYKYKIQKLRSQIEEFERRAKV